LGTDAVSVGGSATALFGDKNVGNNKSVAVSGYTVLGADAANYTVVQPLGLSASITPATLTVSGVTAQNKVYDATVTATLTGSAQVTPLGSDVVTIGGNVLAQFADRHVGINKAVSGSGYTLLGVDAGNYNVVQPAGLTASITPATLSVNGVLAQNKVYDATAGATLGGTGQVTPLGADVVQLAGNAMAVFGDKNAGSNKAVSVSGYTLLGADAGNYVIQQPGGLTATISPAALAVSGVTAQNKVYDGTDRAALSGNAVVTALGADTVTLAGNAVALFDDANVDNNKPVAVGGYTLAGADAANYVVGQPAGLRASLFAVPVVPAVPVIAPASPVVPAWPPLPVTETRGDLMQLAVQSSGATLDVSALLPAPVIVAEPNSVRPGEYHFPLPAGFRALLDADGSRAATATRTDRAPLPYWLRFDPAARAFVATAIPPNVLPMQVLLTVGTQRRIVEIALSLPLHEVVARTAASPP
jgi:YDG domain